MQITSMASAVRTTSPLCSYSSTSKHRTLCALSTSVQSYPKTKSICVSKWIPQLGLTRFSSWNGLRHLGTSISPRRVKIERNRWCKSKGVYASLFGVGAPEALVIGVVALLVFGPKGLAEVARNLGKTLRQFQPTIRELQEVSREFKSTLEREIGLDEIQGSTPNTYSSNTTKTPTPSSIFSPEDSQTVVDPNGAPSPNKAYSTEDYLKITEVQLKAAAAQQQAQTSPAGESKSELQTRPQGSAFLTTLSLSLSLRSLLTTYIEADAVQEAAAVMPPDQKPKSET
ncbi:hypothetical protein RHGRI_008537 [Rhododendron griersonianum]|uniref:Sec-independent protein translocase protein TATB, chloroplastic n=1 Tax=Rhododendron griersonianum TaxID=479676 RepID=A0AAV6L318_9ERIC|nr:hypothetical protein RHGRI_008537 [Rhododendron griersonianum]